MVADDRLYEYAVVRYVPRVDREEFINIGLLMMCKRRKWMRGEIRIDKNRLTAFDSNTNFDHLLTQASVFTRKDVPSSDLPVEERYRWLSAVKSAVLQVSPSHPGIIPESTSTIEDDDYLNAEFDRLIKELVL